MASAICPDCIHYVYNMGSTRRARTAVAVAVAAAAIESFSFCG